MYYLVIQRENSEENDNDDSSRDLEELIADIDEFDEEAEDSAFREYIGNMMRDDKDMLKKVIKGSFRESIMLRTQEDKELDKQEKVQISLFR